MGKGANGSQYWIRIAIPYSVGGSKRVVGSIMLIYIFLIDRVNKYHNLFLDFIIEQTLPRSGRLQVSHEYTSAPTQARRNRRLDTVSPALTPSHTISLTLHRQR